MIIVLQRFFSQGCIRIGDKTDGAMTGLLGLLSAYTLGVGPRV